MAVVSAVAFAAALCCFYFGARALRTRRAVEQLARGERKGRTDALAWLDPADDPDPRAVSEEQRRDDVSVERGFVLLALGLGCVLLGVFAL
ncbi:MAG: hypothetical protein ABEJ97_09320 [Halobellus sp.]